MKKWLRNTVYAIGAFVTLLLSLYLCLPLYLPSLLSHWTRNYSVEIVRLQTGLPGLSGCSIRRLQLTLANGDEIDLLNIGLRYQLSRAARGQVDAITIDTFQFVPQKIEKAASTVTDNNKPFSLPANIVTHLPFKEITIQSATVANADVPLQLHGKVTGAQFALQGKVKFNDRTAVIDATLDDDWDLRLIARDNDNVVELHGTLDNTELRGTVKAQIDPTSYVQLLPASAQTKIGAADWAGAVELNGSVNMQLTDRRFTPDSVLNADVAAQIPGYVDSLQAKLRVELSGTVLQPVFTVEPGPLLTVRKLRQPLPRDTVTVNLASAVAVSDFSALPQQTISFAIQSDSDEVDVAIRARELSLRAHMPSLWDGLDVAANIVLDQLDPAVITVKKDSRLHLDDVSNIGDVDIALTQDAGVTQNEETLQLRDNTTLSITTAAALVDLAIQGQLKPLDVSLQAQSDDIKVGGNEIGSARADVALTLAQTLRMNGTINVLGLDITSTLDYNPGTQTGTTEVTATRLSQLNGYLSRWCTEIKKGSLKTKANIDLHEQVNVTGTADLKNLNLSFQESPLTNINFQGNWQYQDDFTLSDGTVTGTGVDLGIPLSDVKATLNYNAAELRIPAFEAKSLGGAIRGNDLHWLLNKPDNRITLRLEGVDLYELVSLADYDKLKVSGKINATLPLEIDSARVQVVDGILTAIEPGGEIHVPIDVTNVQGAQKEAFDALRNFHYQTMEGGIAGALALDPEGLLKLGLKIKGQNPDMGRPVTLNLNVEDNTYPIFQTLALFSKLDELGQCKRQ